MRFNKWFEIFPHHQYRATLSLLKKLDGWTPLEVVGIGAAEGFMPNVAVIDTSEAKEWCKAHCKGKWLVFLWCGFFELDEDALRFKLTFG